MKFYHILSYLIVFIINFMHSFHIKDKYAYVNTKLNNRLENENADNNAIKAKNMVIAKITEKQKLKASVSKLADNLGNKLGKGKNNQLTKLIDEIKKEIASEKNIIVKNKFKKLLVNFIQKKKIDKDIIVSDDIVNIVNLDSVNSDLQSIFQIYNFNFTELFNNNSYQQEVIALSQNPTYFVNNTVFCKYLDVFQNNSNFNNMKTRIVVENLRKEVTTIHEKAVKGMNIIKKGIKDNKALNKVGNRAGNIANANATSHMTSSVLDKININLQKGIHPNIINLRRKRNEHPLEKTSVTFYATKDNKSNEKGKIFSVPVIQSVKQVQSVVNVDTKKVFVEKNKDNKSIDDIKDISNRLSNDTNINNTSIAINNPISDIASNNTTITTNQAINNTINNTTTNTNTNNNNSNINNVNTNSSPINITKSLINTNNTIIALNNTNIPNNTNTLNNSNTANKSNNTKTTNPTNPTNTTNPTNNITNCTSDNCTGTDNATNNIINTINNAIKSADSVANKEIKVIQVCSNCMELDHFLKELTKEVLSLKNDIHDTFASSLIQQTFLYKFSAWVMRVNLLRADIFKLNDLLETLKTANCPGQEDNSKKLLLLSSASDHLVEIIQNIQSNEQLDLKVVALS